MLDQKEPDKERGFPGGPGIKNLHWEYKEHRFDPWSRKIPHAVGS